MANLSGNLGGVNDVARTVEAPSQSSGFATALGALGKGFDVVHDTMNLRAQRKRQAAADARAVEDQQIQRERFQREKGGWAADDYAAQSLNVLNTAATGGFAVEATPGAPSTSGPPPVSSELEGLPASANAYVDNAAGQIQRFQAGVAQGKLPPIALDGLANKLFNAGLAKGLSPGLLAKAFKERGVDAFASYEDGQEDQDAAQKARQTERADAYKAGAAALGVSVEGKTEDEIINAGRQSIANNALIDQQERLQRMTAAQNADQRATNVDVREQNDRDATNIGTLRFDGAIEHVLGDILKYTNPTAAPERGSNTGYEMQRAKIEAGLPQYFQQVKAQVLNKMRAGGYSPSAVSAAESAIDNRIKGVIDGLQTGGEAYKSAAQLVNTSFGLTMKETAPLLFQMKTLGIDYSAMPGVIDVIDPKTKAAIGSQLKSILSDGVVDSVEKANLKNIIAVATGKANITDIDSNAGKAQIVKSASDYVVRNNREIAAGGGSPDTWMSFGRQVAIGAASLTPQAGAGNLLKATEVLAGAGTIDAINKLRAGSGTNEEATLLGSAKRSASARLLQSSRQRLNAVLQSGTDKYQILRYDEGKGQWGFVFNDKKWRAETKVGNAYGGGVLQTGASGFADRPVGPSKEANQLLAAMNGNLAFLTRTSEWDNDSPKGTYREVAAYWATNKPTSDMQKAAQAASKRGDITTIGNSILEGFSNIPNIDVTPDNGDIIGPEGTGKNPRSSAQGVGQFTNSTWLSTMRKHFPQLIEGKTEADILAMRSNQELGRRAVAAYRGDNAQYLASKGLPSGRTATALAHFAGPQGAENLLTADPNAPVERVLGSAAVNANPHLRGKTVSETIDWAKGFYKA